MGSPFSRARISAAALAAALLLAACGGGGSASAPAAPAASTVPTAPGSPAATGSIAIDGRAWINFRRSQLGMPALAENTLIDQAAQAHSDYLRSSGSVVHDETAGKPGFTGVTLLDRLKAAGYNFSPTAAYAYGEVISGTQSGSGFYMAEELITAIYHRFVIFEPKFKEIGTGASTNSSGYAYFTADFTANNGYAPGLGKNAIVTWPYNGQTGVATNFLSDYESPDPVPNQNEVGYPISVHADIDVALGVTSFTVRQHGSTSDLQVRLLTRAVDGETPRSGAAIIPLAPLKAGTVYDVSFAGTTDGNPISKSWSFTTK
ncbi:MAG: CAP domain-containing protein [Telluria sp.]